MNFRHFLVQRIGRLFSDKMWIRLKYYQWFHKFPDLKTPKTFNEKLQWLKLYDRRPAYTIMVDKYASKAFVAERIGEKYVVPALGGPWKSFDEIDFDKLPDRFVLKTNHDCGGVVLCRDKAIFDKEKAKAFLEKHLAQNYYLTCREWPYKNVKPAIFAEEYMEDAKTEELRDYKFFCFDGEVRALFVATERQKAGEEVKFDYFDEKYHHLECRQMHPCAKTPPEKPECFETMKELASKLSAGIPHVRVDFYEVDGKVYFGELTFYHFSGLVPFSPSKWDEIFGSWLVLPNGR